MSDDVQLSKRYTIRRYRECVRAKDCAAIASLVRARFVERYLDPITKPPSHLKHGFTTMAICCLMVETLEAFRKGLTSTKNKSQAQFVSFFQEHPAFTAFRAQADFYTSVRCGILHEAETRSGWRIRRTGPLLDGKCINATAFARALRKVLDDYVSALERGPWDEAVCVRARAKLNAICKIS